MIAEVSAVQWLIGWIVAVALVVVVAVLVLAIIYLAAKIKAELLGIHAALIQARENTAPLWVVQDTNRVAADILDAAKQARGVLGG